jgi:hypothetical protein
MKTKWTTLMLASAALALLMAGTSDRPVGRAGSIAPGLRGSDGDIRHRTSAEGCDCRKVACNPFCM